MEASSAPVLSTPAEHIFETAPLATTGSTLSEEQLYLQYEVRRTVREIRDGRWTRIALQFPDDMLRDGPRVAESLSRELRAERKRSKTHQESKEAEGKDGVEDAAKEIEAVNLENETEADVAGMGQSKTQVPEDEDARFTILGDTSYGACCVDEIAAEHASADIVVHYGRSCLSPTARLPVIYVFTAQPLDLSSAVEAFKATYPDASEKVVLMADIPFQHHIPLLHEHLSQEGYGNLFAAEILHNPSSPLPNRTVPSEVSSDPPSLHSYSVFHIADPPASLLLTLSSRVKAINILPAATPSTGIPSTLQTNTTASLRRRYALLTRVSSAPIIGILINTLSVRNYLAALTHCQDLITRAGKKSYTFVVGKLNAAKVANFAEVDGWVVIGCWESSLVDSGEFYRPIVTPFELEMALTDDRERVWGGEWVSDFGALLGRDVKGKDGSVHEVREENGDATTTTTTTTTGNWEDEPSDDEPPDFDLRTGRYVSHARPMGRARPTVAFHNPASNQGDSSGSPAAPRPPPSSSLVQRAKGDLAAVNGAASPGAEFLRLQRTWKGLGSDYEIEYERDEEGRIRGAGMEEGRGGVARGYVVSGSQEG